MSRLSLLLDFMRQRQLISIADHPSPSQQACIAIVCHLEKSEQSYGPQVRQLCIQIKRQLEALRSSSSSIPDNVQVHLDMR